MPDDFPAGWFERYPTAEDLIQAAMRSVPTAKLRERFQYNNYGISRRAKRWRRRTTPRSSAS